MNRGDLREAIFRNDADRGLFLSTLGEAFRKELLGRVEERRGASHYGEELRESATERKVVSMCGTDRFRPLPWSQTAIKRRGIQPVSQVGQPLCVQELIRLSKLSAAFAEQLNPSVGATYHELWTELQELPSI